MLFFKFAGLGVLVSEDKVNLLEMDERVIVFKSMEDRIPWYQDRSNQGRT